MKRKEKLILSVLALAGVFQCTNQKAEASFWMGISPGAYGGSASWRTPVIIERGDTSVYEFTFQGTIGASYDSDWVPYAKIVSNYEPEEVFFSLDPVELVREKEWETLHILAGETHSVGFTVYVSNPHLEPTLPGELYKLRTAWSPYPDTPGGGIGVRGEAIGWIGMEVTPEPATLTLLTLGSLAILRRRRKREMCK